MLCVLQEERYLERARAKMVTENQEFEGMRVGQVGTTRRSACPTLILIQSTMHD